MKIEELIDKYFEGETSCEEERRLGRFFAGNGVPPHLERYRPLFAHLGHEARAHGKRPARRRTATARILFLAADIAACLLLAFGIGRMVTHTPATPESFVVINGVRHTDPALVERKAREAMQDVILSPEELQGLMFPDLEQDQ